ncbi:helix-turn-helix domain-containing protein [Bariatricus massiliensis]|uniref:Helix-turn-helix domain-containing protein n=1 Tax=Bariatricus massiliensis TaxID=1745713 RepID=A0ABS8DN95_9FIRM|nr:helix-turn-helix domain-containing protein [Bariatricus massiliensis]MCB7306115.1 helix-turn-helix domain-containing protein [Bariatricus massiliensis]MCB7376676.1 helix-turn-helix domain-containing protein [Bariatricus massiliensis]MCB7389334.1 helix-turn-helix domain-containing protein [Bariatricus massiliensis]MCB7413479.1 helix-turn-helix domain-containing protein [Bariatricus massiliensis]MCQ5254350.1 helix-turn-helix domain-containing protein [Bariatricus massiliensis]
MDEEEQLFQQTVEWLPSKLSTTPVFMKQQVAEFQIDPFTRIFINDKGEKVYLTTKEFDLLYFLFCHRGQIFTKEHLYESVWGYDNEIDGSNLTSFIRKLRKKIEPFPANPKYILTVWGVGYKSNENIPN